MLFVDFLLRCKNFVIKKINSPRKASEKRCIFYKFIVSTCLIVMDMKGRVIIYSIIGCPHCLRAKNKLADLGLRYLDVPLERFPQQRDYVKQLTGGKSTVPQIFFNEIYIGGNDDLQKLVKDKARLEELIEMLKTAEPPSTAPQPPDPSTAVDGDKNDGEFVCEPDEYVLVVRDMKKANLIGDHRIGLWNYKNSFKGAEFIKWMVKEKGLDETKAIEMGQMLISRHFGHVLKTKSDEPFSPDKYYRLLEDDETRALNAGPTSECAPLEATELGETLRRLILKIYNKGLSSNGKEIDYGAIAKEADFGKYVMLTKELQRIDLMSCSPEEKLSFFINIYNTLVIHGTIIRGPATNLWQRYKFFNTIKYIIGGQSYSLQDIENGILRANRKGKGMFMKPFGKNDQRLKIALEEHEPLIHFALNCGAKSCPPIKTFSAKGIKAELKVATEAFLESEDGLKIDSKQNRVYLSQIFKWYKDDFDCDILRWASEHMASSEKKTELDCLIEKGASVKYMAYDWGHNSKT